MPESAARYHEGYCDEEQDGLRDERVSHLAQSGLHIRLGPYPLSPGFSVSSMTVKLCIICYHNIALALAGNLPADLDRRECALGANIGESTRDS